MNTTQNTPVMPPPSRNRRQVRVFVIVWMALTLLMGACIFVAIYFASADTSLAALTAPTATRVPATATLLPTTAASPTATLAEEEPTEEAAPEEPTPEPEPTLLPREDPTFGYGVQVKENFEYIGMYYDMVAYELGFTWIKQQIRWEDLEPEKGQIDFAIPDLVVPAAAERGLKMMFSVVTAPDWSRPTGANLEEEGPPADFQDYADFLTALLERHPGQIHAIEVWNEENLDREWNDPQGLSAARYVEMLAAAEQAIHAVDPGVIVISGALSPTGVNNEFAIDDWVYFDQLIAAGLLNYADCVGAHHNGYNIPPDAEWDNQAAMGPVAEHFKGPWENPDHSWSFRSTLEYYYKAIVNAGGSQKLCITEFGWATLEDVEGGYPKNFEFALDNTLAEQAEWSVQAFEWLADWEGAWIAFLWNLNYSPLAGGDPTNDNVPYSILHDVGTGDPRRPAFYMLQAMPKE